MIAASNLVAILVAALSRLDDSTHAGAARALARRLGRVMPFWYAATVILATLVTVTRPVGSASQWLSGGAAALFAAAIVFTILGPVPINNRIAAWDLSALPEGWRADRQRWDRLHGFRVIILLVAVSLLTGAVLSGRA